MHLAPGTRLGPYETGARIGAGGMGEVYRARDTRLGRDVAIKTSKQAFDERFQREARAIAALNHANICTLYDVGPDYLVMEYVEGQTLSERIAQGPLSEPDALAVAMQIAAALESAHDRGIVHRDLKPANIKIKPDGQVKVLDFGLAKMISSSDSTSVNPAESPTLTGHLGTGLGVIIGTAAYMAPEQARSQVVDKRADIWAFGVVLWEMLIGRRPFAGDTATDALASVLKDEPPWDDLPARLRPLLRRCLEKDPRKRLHDIADARLWLEEPPPAANPRPLRPFMGWMLAGFSVAAIVVVGVAYYRKAPPAEAPMEFAIAPPEDWLLLSEFPAPTFELSPDGRYVAIIAKLRGAFALWVRMLTDPVWHQLTGTEGAVGNVFWSPDSQSIGFFAAGDLKTVKLAGGSPVTICQARLGQGASGTWNRDDVIVFGATSNLLSVSADGGTPLPATSLAAGESAHRWPSFLPDGRHFLYVAQGAKADELRIGALGSAETESLGPFASNATYAAGHLVFVYNNRLMAQPFDADARRFTGDPVSIAEPTAVLAPLARGQFSVSQTGRLAYSAIGRPVFQLTWVDRSGNSLGTVGEAGYYTNVNLSPNDQQVVVSRLTEPPGQPWNFDIWVIDVARGGGGATRLTVDPAREYDPVFSPNGKEVAFNSNRTDGAFSLFRRPSNPGGQDELLVLEKSRARAITGPDWSSDGRFIVYDNAGDLWVVALSGEKRPTPIEPTPYQESNPEISPDGRWVAYESDRSGRMEVYVRPFPSGEGEFPISHDGGHAPRWRRQGGEIFFLTLDGTMMSATIHSSPEFKPEAPRALFKTTMTSIVNRHPYAVVRDGQRFLIPVLPNRLGATPISVVFNWPARLRK